MKKWLQLCIPVLFAIAAQAQTETVYHVKEGQELGDVLKFSDVYRYPAFQFGTVIFRDDRQATALLNYNLLSGEMDFVNRELDTMALANEKTVRYILIDPDTFYFAEKAYIRQLAAHGDNRLGKRDMISLADTKKIGAFGQPATAGVESYSSWKSFKLKMKMDMTLVKQSIFYFSNGNKWMPANRKNVLKLYPRYEAQLSTYIDTNATDFSIEDQVVALFKYLSSLDKKRSL